MSSQKIYAIVIALVCFLASPLFSQTGVIRGTVTNALNNEPIPFANVLIQPLGTGETPDIDGKFEITGLIPALYNIEVSYLGFSTFYDYELQVTNAKPLELEVQLDEQIENLQEVVVKASPFRKTEESPVSLRNIGVAEIQRNPGGNRDISRVLQVLPGVASTASFRNDLIIRGGSPNENRFYLDEIEVPNINHFATQGASGGPDGMINVNFIREVDFYSGAFPANRGNTLSSVLNFKLKDGRNDKLGGSFNVSATDIGLTLEGPINKKTTFLASARRSYLQFLFDVIGLPFLPTYNDFQFKVKHKIDQKNELSFIGLGAIDQFKLNLDANDTEDKQFLLDNLPVAPQWNYAIGATYKHYEDDGYWTFVLSRNMLNNEAQKYFKNDDSSPDNLILDYRSQEIENKLRLERTQRLGDYKFNYGVGYEYARFNNSTFNRIFSSSGPQTVDFFSEFDVNKYSFFGQISRKFKGEKLILSLGVRADANDLSSEMSNPLQQLSPRFSMALALSDRLSLNFNTGVYYQLPPYTILGYQDDNRFVNIDNGAKYIRNWHMVTGFEFNTASNSKITLEGYYKRYSDYPFLLRDSLSLANVGGDFGTVGNEPAVSTSIGQSFGLEFLFQQRLFRGFYGIASYTLGWSEFRDKNDILTPSSWDSRHIFNLAFGKRFGKNWEVGINWRYQSALPFTPFSDASSLVNNWDVNGRGLRDFNQLNALRSEAVSVIDVRVDKKWFFKKWSLNLYLDLENVTSSSVTSPELILDRPLDENNMPIGPGIIANPDAPSAEQRYELKRIMDSTGNLIPSIGIQIYF